MYIILVYYDILDILELQVYLPSEDNFYYYLSMLSSIPGRKVKSNCVVEVEFFLSFQKDDFYGLMYPNEVLTEYSAFYPWETYTFLVALCSDITHVI